MRWSLRFAVTASYFSVLWGPQRHEIVTAKISSPRNFSPRSFVLSPVQLNSHRFSVIASRDAVWLELKQHRQKKHKKAAKRNTTVESNAEKGDCECWWVVRKGKKVTSEANVKKKFSGTIRKSWNKPNRCLSAKQHFLGFCFHNQRNNTEDSQTQSEITESTNPWIYCKSFVSGVACVSVCSSVQSCEIENSWEEENRRPRERIRRLRLEPREATIGARKML